MDAGGCGGACGEVSAICDVVAVVALGAALSEQEAAPTAPASYPADEEGTSACTARDAAPHANSSTSIGCTVHRRNAADHPLCASATPEVALLPALCLVLDLLASMALIASDATISDAIHTPAAAHRILPTASCETSSSALHTHTAADVQTLMTSPWPAASALGV